MAEDAKLNSSVIRRLEDEKVQCTRRFFFLKEEKDSRKKSINRFL